MTTINILNQASDCELQQVDMTMYQELCKAANDT